MNIVKDSWHVKVYQNWYLAKNRQYGEWRFNYDIQDYEWVQHPPPNHTNLCPYIRAVLFWSWGRYCFLNKNKKIVAATWSILVVLTLMAIDVLFGPKTLFNVIAVLLFVALLTITGCIATAISYLLHKPRVQRNTKFRSVLKEYKKSVHDKICPVIDFVD